MSKALEDQNVLSPGFSGLNINEAFYQEGRTNYSGGNRRLRAHEMCFVFQFDGRGRAPGTLMGQFSQHTQGNLWLSSFSRSAVSNSLQARGLRHTRLLCPPLSPEVCSNSCPSSPWCHPTISSSVTGFFSCPQSIPASGPFPMSRLFTLGSQSPEKAMALHSSTLAWKIPWTEEPGKLQSMGSRRGGHDWATSLSLFTFMHWRRK